MSTCHQCTGPLLSAEEVAGLCFACANGGVGNRIVFGQGQISVSTAEQDGLFLVLLERGLGSGRIGEYGSSRPVGAVLPSTTVDAATCVLEFHRAESVQVVIDALEQVKGWLEEQARHAAAFGAAETLLHDLGEPSP